MTATHTEPFRPVSVVLLRGTLTMLGALLAVSLFVMPVMLFTSIENGVVSAFTAGTFCFVCGVAAIVVMDYYQRRDNALVGALLAMAIRMVPPLTVCLVLALGFSPMDVFPLATGAFDFRPFVGSLLVYYLAALAVDIWLATQSISHSGSISHSRLPQTESV